jgi:importin-4
VQLNQEFYKNPACISALASVLANSPEFPVGLDRVTFSLLINTFQVRQLAAVELRKRVSQNSGNFWTLLPQNEREEIKAKLPELILAESKSV